MLARQAFDWGMLAGMLFMIGATAIHWFITPMSHPHTTPLETCFAVAELVVGFGGGAWLYTRRRPSRSDGRPAVL